MGKNKYIESPEKMAEYFETYKTETKSNPIKKHVFVGKDGNADYELIERPLTVDGFELWCWRNEIISDLSQYFANTENRYKEYQTICSRIRKEVRNDQIEKGLAGIYNTSITQRLNGLTDKSEITVKEQPLFPDDKF
jgi:hypothetical protein